MKQETDAAAQGGGAQKGGLALTRRGWAFALGAGCMFAWFYLAFFYGMATPEEAGGVPLRPDRYWAIAAGCQGAGACVLIALGRRWSFPDSLLRCAACALAVAAGTLALGAGLAFSEDMRAWSRVAAGAAGLFAAPLWYSHIRMLLRAAPGEAGVAVPLSLVMALAAYFVVHALPGFAPAVVCALLPLASLAPRLVASRWDEREAEGEGPAGAVARDGASLPSSVPRAAGARAAALVFLLWMNIAFFTTVAKPWKHGVLISTLYPALIAVLLATAAILLVVAVKGSGRAERNRTPRAIALLLCLSYVFLYIDFSNMVVGICSCVLCSLCIVLLQRYVWVVGAEAFSSLPCRPDRWLFGYLAAEGFGIALGISLGINLCECFNRSIPATVPFLFLAVLFFAVMAVDMGEILPSTAPAEGGEVEEDSPEERFEALCDQCGLSERERDVAQLLVAGRNRPFIQEALFLSSGTVNFHVSNIYRKAGVHSQQELISLFSGERP